MNKKKTIAFFKTHGLKIAVTLVGAGLVVLFALKMDDWADAITQKLQAANTGGQTGNNGNATPPPPPSTPSIPSGPSFDLERYAEDAESLYRAMNRWGTDEATILRIMNDLKTEQDLQLLSEAFGTRSNTGLGSFTGNLVQWFIEDLDAQELLLIKFIYQRLNTPFR